MQLRSSEKPSIDFSSYEMVVNVCGKEKRVFFQSGFLKHVTALENKSSSYSLTPLHRHSYPEIHLFVGEGIKVTLGSESIVLETGTALMIPKLTYHSLDIPEGAMHCAFQIDTPMSEIKQARMPIDLLCEFMSEVGKCSSLADFPRLERYFSFIISYFISFAPQKAKKTTDYPFVIHEFISHYYNLDIHLSDLAERLRVTERQTARLLLKHTGKSFNDELTSYRISAAEQLMSINPSLPMSTVATLVGYQSQSGFWKAYKRYHEKIKD